MAAASERVVWVPAKTRALFVGVCKLKGETEYDWDPSTRRDTVLVDTLVARGVPRGNIVTLLDDAATLKEVTAALQRQCAAAAEDETFMFYYDGHGMRGEEEKNAGCLQLCVSDCEEAGCFPISDVFTHVERYFKGHRALIFLDCCFSGTAVGTAFQRAGRVQYGVMTSQMAAQTSTGEWTFTDALINGFGQKLAVDLSGDGVLLFSELATYMEALMASEAGQLSMNAGVNGFPAEFVLGTCAAGGGPKPPPCASGPVYPPGSHVRVLDATRTGKRASEFVPAIVLAERKGCHLVRITGKGEIDDVWVGPDEIEHDSVRTASGKSIGGAGAVAAGAATGGAAAATGKGGVFAVGQHVQARWGDGKEYPGWFDGIVAGVGHSYDVEYTEDGNEATVTSKHIRGGDLSVGARAEAMWMEGEDADYPGWFKVKIKAVNVTYAINYADGSEDENVEARSVRASR